MLKEYQVLYLDNDIPINRSFYCNNGDIKSRGLEVHVLDNSQAKDCTGLTLRMIVKVPSGEMFEATVANGLVTVLNATSGIFQVLFPNNMGRGRLIAEIQLSNVVPEIIVSRKFSILGDGSLTSDGSISELPGAGILQEVIQNEAQRQADFVAMLGSLDEAVATKYAELETEYAPELNLVKTQLAENATRTAITDQVDYVKHLQQLMGVRNVLSVKIEQGALKQFYVNQRVTTLLGTTYAFRKDANDDYITLMEGSLGTINELTSVVNSKNNETELGTFWKTAPNYYTTTIGDWIAGAFIGTKVSFLSYANNQGGLWEAILDEGTGDERRLNVSVYSATTIVIKEQTLFDNLDRKKHTIKLVFKGQDPANPLASPRGWYFFGGTREQDTSRTFNIYDDSFSITKTVDAMYSYSNKEVAISARPAGSGLAYQYVPEHNAIGTAFNLQDTILLVDGKQVTWKTGNYYNGEVVQLIQKVKGVHTSDLVNPMFEIITYHTIKNGVVIVSVKVKVLRDIEIDVGYGIMFPYFVSFAKKIKTGLGNEYTVLADGSKEYWIEGDKTQSFVIVNDVDVDDKANVATAMTIDNFNRSTRHGENGVGVPYSWIEHNATRGKIYHQQLKNVTLTAGTELNFDGRYIVAYLNNVNQFIL